MSKSIKTELEALHACGDAVEWASQYKGARQRAWEQCERPDWMLWYLGKKVNAGAFDRKRLVLAACACARTSLKFVPEGENRPLKAIETAESWARGEGGVTLADVKLAYAAVATAAVAAYAAAAVAAAYAAYAAADAAARKTAYATMARIIRKRIPKISEAMAKGETDG